MDMDLVIIFGSLFVALPWLILHYVTQWKKGRSISSDDEQLLDQLHHMAQRLDDRINTIERIMTAENPDWKRLSHQGEETLSTKIEDRDTNIRRVS